MPARTKLIQGTFILTFVGILSRFMGFFFRMFTSHVFGEENIGLYQLIFPVYLFCLSLSTAGIEAAISRTAAQKASRGKYIEAQSILYTGLFFSVLFSIIQMLLLQKYALWLPSTGWGMQDVPISFFWLPMLCPLLLSIPASQDIVTVCKKPQFPLYRSF